MLLQMISHRYKLLAGKVLKLIISRILKDIDIRIVKFVLACVISVLRATNKK